MSVYALSDLHGNEILFNKILNFLAPNDKVYFLGDAADRGKVGFRLIKQIYEDPRFIYVKGNHEDMLIKAMEEFCSEHEKGEAFRLLAYNGGKNTFDEWRKFGTNITWAKKLKNLPSWVAYINNKGQFISMSHAGFTPHQNEFPKKTDLIWSREHFLDDWDEQIKNTIVVHGHTPIIFLAEDLGLNLTELEPKPLWYCDNKKVCIDLGTYMTDATMLLNLDTFKYHLFQEF